MERVDFDGAVCFVIPIAERRVTGIHALGSLFPHSLLDLLAEVVRIVPRHDEVDAVDELRLGLGVLRYNLALFHQVRFDVQILQRDRITEVAIKSVSLLYQQGRGMTDSA